MKEKENRLSIGTINGVEIYAVKDDNGKEIVPLKPICSALGVSYSSQVQKVQSHPIYSSTVLLSNTVGADGKDRDMLCIDAEFVYGWLLGINPDNVSDQVRDNLIKYQIECHHALYRHFHGRAQRQAESNQAEAAELERLRQLIGQEKEVKSQINETKKRIDSIRAARLDDQPTLFD